MGGIWLKKFLLGICGGIPALAGVFLLFGSPIAIADTLFYDRSAQLIENPVGKYRDVFDIFSVDSNTQFTQRLTTTPTGSEFDNAEGALNSAGNLVVFYSYRHREEAGNGNTAELYTMAPDGSQETRITTNAGIDDAFPQWCGSFIVFTRTDNASSTAGDIYRINPDRSGLAPVIQTGEDEFDPDCHEASGKLTYVRQVAGNDRKIMVSNIDGTNQVTLTSIPSICSAPRWSSDGQWIVYACDHHDPQTFKQDVYRMKPFDTSPQDGEGDERERLTISPTGSIAQNPVISPDGTKIGWTRVTGPEMTVYSKTIGLSDDAPISFIDGRSFLSDWK